MAAASIEPNGKQADDIAEIRIMLLPDWPSPATRSGGN
jgi:hypothetical protein